MLPQSSGADAGRPPDTAPPPPDRVTSNQQQSEEAEAIPPPTYTTADQTDAHPQLPSSSAPHASASGSRCSDSMIAASSDFDIAPRADATSFQVGYLGLENLGFQAWVKGDVLAKLDVAQEDAAQYDRCIITLLATEFVTRGLGESSIELFSSKQTLWERNAPSSSAVAPDPPIQIPTTMPFSFSLTPDLPHCIHLPHSGLAYRLEATLHSADAARWQDIRKSVPLHLTRYSPPGPIDPHLQSTSTAPSKASDAPLHTLEPHIWNLTAPTHIQIRLARTLYRRAEPIELCFRIPSPDPAANAEKSLRLRSVEADLVRVITAKGSWLAEGKGLSEDNPSVTNEEKVGSASLTEVGSEGKSVDDSPTRIDDDDHPSEGPTVSSTTLSDHDTHQEALLAHSGKLCRFHSRRAVFMRLTLHPPFDRSNMPHPHPDHDTASSAGPVYGRGGGGGCESVSQETLLHEVAFEVRIRIAITGGQGEARDLRCHRRVLILPGAAGGLERDVEAHQVSTAPSAEDAPVATPTEATPTMSHFLEKQREQAEEDGAGRASTSDTADFQGWETEVEYDGYEDIGRSLDQEHDDDAGPSTTTSSRDETLHTHRDDNSAYHLDPQSRAHDPPPTLLESQHDLQVEVEVEGVGMAMPRYSSPHLQNDNDDLTHRIAESPDDPPPNIWDHSTPYTQLLPDATSGPSSTLTSSSDATPVLAGLTTQRASLDAHAQLQDSANERDHAEQPGDLPPPHSPPRPTYFALAAPTTNGSATGTSDAVEPPPYGYASGQRMHAAPTVPSNRARELERLPVVTLGRIAHADAHDSDGGPPAYAHEEGEERGPVLAGVVQGRPPGYEA